MRAENPGKRGWEMEGKNLKILGKDARKSLEKKVENPGREGKKILGIEGGKSWKGG